MRVSITDPQGPRIWRMLPYALPFLMLPLAVSGLLGATGSALLAGGAAAVFNLLGLVPLRQRAPRTAELVCGPGYVDVTNAGSRNQRIRAKDITGATTARTPMGLLLTLEHRKRKQPLTLEVSSEAEVENVRHALGIGHGGFGTIAWSTLNDTTANAAIVGRVLATVVALLTIGVTLAVSVEAAILVATTLGQVGAIGSVLGLMGLLSKGPQASIVMGPDGLRLKTPKGWFALPYEAVKTIENIRRGLVFHIPEPYFSVSVERASPVFGGVSDQDAGIVVSQIEAAALRARGLGPIKNDVTGRLDVLRRNGESPRDWLVRLDMAGQMLSSGSGYRGNTLDAEDLWTILEDPEADADLRAAAARVLRHQQRPETRVRIDAAVAAVRDATANRRLRIAIQDDLEGASQELAILDANEPRRQVMYHTPPPPRSMYGR
jgi:hypothetical protein